MKIMRRIMVLCLVLSLAVTGYVPQTVSAAKKVKLNKKSVSIKVGKKVKLQVNNTKKKVSWSVKSGKKYIALKSKKKNSVVVQAKKAGTAKVQAKIGKKKLICTVKVKKASSSASDKNDDKKDKKVTGVPGKNVDLPAGAAAFTMGTKKLAIGMAKQDVYTVLGSLSTQELRDTGKSPQGFDVIAFNTDDYSEYLLIYLKDDKVTGICGIGKTMSFGDAVAGASGTALSTEWKNAGDYKTIEGKTKKDVAARTKTISATECAYAFYDAWDDNQIYCIQVFDPTKIKKADDDMIFSSSGNLTYDDTVKTSIATETGKMLNAFRAYYGKTVFQMNDKMANCAQDWCNQAAQSGVKEIQSRGAATMFGILDGYGVSVGDCAETCYSSAADAISFFNSVIEMKDCYEYVMDATLKYAGVGMAEASKVSHLYIIYADTTNW